MVVEVYHTGDAQLCFLPVGKEFLMVDPFGLENDDYIFIPGVREALMNKAEVIKGYIVNKGMKEISLKLGALTDDERTIIEKGCLINYYRD